MARLHSNFQSGLLSVGVGAADTAISSAAFASLPVVAIPDTLAVVLDPRAVGGAPEIVTVTAHTASATSVTVTRGQEGTSARSHLSSTTWVHAVSKADIENFGVTPSSIDPDDVAAEGTSTGYARGDHVHSILAGPPTTIVPDDVVAEGDSGAFARANHVHGVAADIPVSVGTALAEGASTSFARANHVHDVGAGAVGTGQLVDAAVTTAKIVDDAVTAAKLAPALPLGEVGYARDEDGTGGIVGSEVTVVSVAVSVVSGRKYRISGGIRSISTTANAVILSLRLKADSTQLTERVSPTHDDAGSGVNGMEISTRFQAASTALVTFSMVAIRAAGTGTLSITAAPTLPSELLVEDIGA